MQRHALDRVVLQLKALGIHNVLRFDFPSAPPVESLEHALELLYALAAIDDDGRLTRLGAQCAMLPLSPQLGMALLRANKHNVEPELLSVVAMTSVGQVFGSATRGTTDHRGFGVYEGDHLSLLNVYNGFAAEQFSPRWCQKRGVRYKPLLRAVAIRAQIKKQLKQVRATAKQMELDAAAKKAEAAAQSGNDATYDPFNATGAKKKQVTIALEKDTEPAVIEEKELPSTTTEEEISVRVRKALVVGLFANAACLSRHGSYQTVRGKESLFIHPSSVLFQRPPKWLIYHQVEFSEKQYMRDVSQIDSKWLPELAPHFFAFDTSASAN